MKVKVILKSLLFSYAVTGAFLLFLAFLLFQFDLGEKPVSAGIVAVYILSCFSGGFMSGKILRKDKYLWGILVGAFYYLLLITVSFVVQGKWEMSLVHAVTTFFRLAFFFHISRRLRTLSSVTQWPFMRSTSA